MKETVNNLGIKMDQNKKDELKINYEPVLEKMKDTTQMSDILGDSHAIPR